MVRTLPYGSNPHLDRGRVLAYAAVVSVHAAAALLLLLPLTAPPLDIVANPDDTTVEFVPARKEVEVMQEREVVKERRTTEKREVVPTKRPATPVNDMPVIVDGGNIPVDSSIADTSVVDSIAEIAGPVSVDQLAYLKATPPPYPRTEQNAGIGGTVLLRILVDTDGTPLEVLVERSSGNRNLDRSAQRHVLKTWRFQPAMQDGHAVQAYGLVPIVFSIQ